MLHDRIVDNKKIGGKIWKICTAFNNDLHSIDRFVLRWMIWTTLNDLYSVELFVQRWVICAALNDLYYVEWFVQRSMIFTTLKNLYVERFRVRSMICALLNHLDYYELLSIGFLMNGACVYLRKYCKIFYTNLWVDFFSNLQI